MKGIGRLAQMVGRTPMRLLRAVQSPLLAACLASGLTALLLGGPPEVQTIREVKVIQQIPGTTRYVTVNRSTCDAGKVKTLLDNAVKNSSARTGTASFDNESASSTTPGGGAHADGDNAAAVSQQGTAISGDVVLGQVVNTLNACGSVTINASNTVTDSKGESGSAEVSNDSQVAVGGGGSFSSPSPSPSPEVFESLVATPTPAPTSSATAILPQSSSTP